MKRASAAFVTSAAGKGQFPRDGVPEVAFLGRSNVGKSSLLNALAGTRNLARVSATPGRTRLVNFFRVAVQGTGPLYLVDLPGYGYARAPASERRGFEELALSYLVNRPALALCVFLVDARHEPMESDQMLRAFLEEQQLTYLVAATKADKLGRGARRDRERRLREFAPAARDVIAVSASTAEGVDLLWSRIREAVAP